ncbi:MAG TPA: FtsX-like permease family protein [Tepidisphaeraceae bacterium]|nr:FtsX-like permease family protein [Tepidisphaeraceae bacterium]
MTLAQYARLIVRESRRSRGRIALFMGCIAVGVAAIVLVAGLSTSVSDGVRSEGRRLMAADLVVESRQPLPPELDTILASYSPGSVERADVREFVSVIVAPDAQSSLLAELKVVGSGYPFYGDLRLDPPQPLQQLLTSDTVVVAPEILARLNLKASDALRIGGADFRIAGTVIAEPDKLSITFTLGPRVFLSPDGLARTQLIGKGSRVEYRALVKLPQGSTAEDAQRLERMLGAGEPAEDSYRVRTFTEAQPQLRRSFDRVGRYLGLVGLLSLLVGGVGVAQVARAWLASRMDDIAILRCLGATPREVVNVYLAQVLLISLAASVVGALIGTLFHWLLPRWMPGLVPVDLVHPWQPEAMVRGVFLGIGVAVVFTLPLLIGLRRVPPVRVLRRDAEPLRSGWLAQGLAALLILSGVWGMAASQADDLEHGTWFTIGLVIAVLLLWLAATLVSRAARLLPRDAGGVRLRHGLAHLARPGAGTVGAIVAIGLGVTFVFATWLVERHLTDQLAAELPADAPSTFFLDVQPDQWPRIEQILKESGAEDIVSRPMVNARFAAIRGVPVAQLLEQQRKNPPPPPRHDPQRAERDDNRRGPERPRSRPRRWTLTRELRITYGDQLPRGNRIIAGTFPASPGIPNALSLEEDYANDLGVTVGDTVTLDVQGVPVELTVTSIRTIDWRTMGMNFFLFAEPGPLDNAPQVRLATVRLETADLPRIQAAIVSAFPNVTVIHVREVMEKVMAVLRNIGLGVRALGAFTIAAGIIVLGGTVAATQARRAREVALLKTIGMTRRDVLAVFAIEYALTGFVAAVVGLAAASLLAWATLTQLMDLDWSPKWSELLLAATITIALAIAAGLVASARALAARPAEVLRSE